MPSHTSVKILRNIQIEMERERIARRFLSRTGSRNSALVMNIFEESFDTALSLICPAAAYIETGIAMIEDRRIVFTDFDLPVESRYISEHMTGAKRASFFLATIGRAVEDEAKKSLKDGSDTRGVMLDLLGSEAVEAVADSVNKVIDANAELKGFHTLKRRSPGYGDWGLANQPLLVEFLAGAQLGVSVSDSFQMIPEKSITALVPWVLLNDVRGVL